MTSLGMWRRVLFLMTALVAVCGLRAAAQTLVYSQPSDSSGTIYKSSWYDPEGLDDDEYVWDAFTLPSATAITRVTWRGGYGMYGPGAHTPSKFTVAIYGSIAGGFQPDIVAGPLKKYTFNNSAGETPAGMASGHALYDYGVNLPTAFQAQAGVKYWVQIQASQIFYPDWGLAKATGGEGSHFRKIGGTGGMYQYISGDCAFGIYTSGGAQYTINASAQPTGAGTITGAGVYPTGTNATLVASAATGFAFQNWTENGAQVSTNPNYTFAVTRSRDLVANFTAAYAVTTSVWPSYGGSASGGGTFSAGSNVTVTAVANPGFDFAGWTEWGSPVSNDAVYTFAADADHDLVANFVTQPDVAMFDIDDAPVHTSLPVSLASGGLGAVFMGGYSIQPFGTVGIAPAGMGGLYIWPNSVFQADLTIEFSQPVTEFSIMYSPQELACDTSARMRATGFSGVMEVATDTTTAPAPGVWPTGTLRLVSATPFDTVVVHYDAAPPGCQDYGVIFVADNMWARVACTTPVIAQDPTAVVTCPASGAWFGVGVSGLGAYAYQWQLYDTPSGVWVDLVEGDNVLPSGGTVGAIGAGLNNVVLTAASTASAMQLPANTQVRCVVSSACGAATSAAADLAVCVADVSCDQVVDLVDFFQFFNDFDQTLPGADVNGDWSVDLGDFFAFFNGFDAGC